ncbi:hypothetical protein ACLOJK_027910 [Asimina triloba]
MASSPFSLAAETHHAHASITIFFRLAAPITSSPSAARHLIRPAPSRSSDARDPSAGKDELDGHDRPISSVAPFAHLAGDSSPSTASNARPAPLPKSGQRPQIAQPISGHLVFSVHAHDPANKTVQSRQLHATRPWLAASARSTSLQPDLAVNTTRQQCPRLFPSTSIAHASSPSMI